MSSSSVAFVVAKQIHGTEITSVSNHSTMNLAVGLDGDYTDKYLVTDLNFVLNLLYPVVGKAADVYQALLAGLELYLCADGQNVYYLAQEYAADFDITADIVYHALCGSGSLCIGRGDEYAAVILQVDLNAGSSDDAVDGLADMSLIRP